MTRFAFLRHARWRSMGLASPFVLVLVLPLVLAAPAHAQREATVPDPDPELERQSFELPDGYEVNLFAGDPLLAKPIQINFDARGRLWVASSEVYPQIEPGQTANDKILILEDADGDGKADSTTVFADGLLIPTGVAPGGGGAYVANSTELLFLKDTNGDGKADTRDVVLSGFGTEDTHHIIHTFRWGVDGELYFNQSTYIHSYVETPWGPRQLGGGGVWRFRPETRRLEIFTRGLINPWGHQVDAWGQHFATDGAGGEGINFLVRGASYAWTPGAPRIVAGLNPGSPKHCGLEVLSGRHLPDAAQGLLVTSDFRAHRVCRFELSEDGSGFASRELPELIKTRHGAFRPIDAVMGPDGALYIADWYNPIIQHGEVDFRDPRRDHVHGRIWRVTARGRALVERPRLVEASTEALLDRLREPEAWTRSFARQVLKERGAAEVQPRLAEWVARLDRASPQFDSHCLEALWTYQALDVPEPGLLVQTLHAADSRVRAAAVAVIPAWLDRISGVNLLGELATLVNDDAPRVRLEAVCALRAFADPAALRLALQVLDRPMDRFLDYALWQTCRELQATWLPALQAGTLGITDPARLTFALQAVGSADVVGPLLAAVRAGSMTAEQVPPIFRLVGQVGTPDQLSEAALLALATTDPALDALALASAGRNVQPAQIEALVEPISARLRTTPTDPAGRSLAAVHAIGAWRLEALRGPVEDRLKSTEETEPVRLAALEALARLGGEASLAPIEALAEPASSPALQRAAVAGLAGLNLARAAERAAALLAAGPAPADATALFDALLTRKDGPEALLAALNGKTLPRDVAKLGVRLARGTNPPRPDLAEALARAGSLDAPAPLPDTAEIQRMAAAVLEQGDPRRGEALFRRADLQCLKCHAIAGSGGKLGPGLESIGASAQVDYLIDSLFTPNKAVKEGYHSRTIATRDGRILTGIVQKRDDASITLRDSENREQTIRTSDVEEEQAGPSLMPEGLTESLTRAELIDLVRFLSELGKPGPFAVGATRLVRNWEVVPGTDQMAQSIKRIGFDATARGDQPHDTPPIVWQPAYSQVSGNLPVTEIPAQPNLDASPSRRWARFALDVSTAGPVGCQLNATQGLAIWVDGQRVQPGPLLALDLKPGKHQITLAIDPAACPTPELRCELVDLPGSNARARIVMD